MSDVITTVRLRKKSQHAFLLRPPDEPIKRSRSASPIPSSRRLWTCLSREVDAPDRPCHVAQDSLLSGTSGYTNYRGFFNLSLILLTLSNARVALENVIKYGILVDPVSAMSVFYLQPHKSPIVWLLLTINVYVLPCVYVEKLMVQGILKQWVVRCFYVVNAGLVLFVPALVIFLTKPNPLAASICLCIHSVAFFKIISYAQVNRWCREYNDSENESNENKLKPQSGTSIHKSEQNIRFETKKSDGVLKKQSDAVNCEKSKEAKLKYPENVTVSNMYFFLAAPTLCYELNYPRNDRIRKWFVLKRAFEVLFLFQVIVALSQQWIVPLLKNSVQPFVLMDYSRIVERLLKLAIPNHVLWLLSFYCSFHAFFNLVAELMRFSDRQFYNDWWNAETVQYFWQNWNIPVHKWCVRHLYLPMLGAQYSRTQASLVVFLVSALFHEYVISVPLHLFRLWAFGGMVAQIPLNLLTRSDAVRGRAGNVVVWLSLILGQPLAILMYVHDWYVVHYMAAGAATPVPTLANSTMSNGPTFS